MKTTAALFSVFLLSATIDCAAGGAAVSSDKAIEALKDCVMKSWRPPAGTLTEEKQLVGKVLFRLNKQNDLAAPPTLHQSSGDSLYDDSLVRAVKKCFSTKPLSGFPPFPDPEIIVTFDPIDPF